MHVILREVFFAHFAHIQLMSVILYVHSGSPLLLMCIHLKLYGYIFAPNLASEAAAVS